MGLPPAVHFSRDFSIYTCFFHPPFVDGPALLPFWLALILGAFFLLPMFITSIYIERAGFHMETHEPDVYTVFPGETAIVRGEIYARIRHPLYFALSRPVIYPSLINPVR
jgi:protein-S-isoprenylcysteine O-methyltransferase Ste14